MPDALLADGVDAANDDVRWPWERLLRVAVAFVHRRTRQDHFSMADTAFHGVFPYLVSPVSPSGEIMGDVLERLCNDLITAGVHGLTPLGSTGEFAYLSWPQRRRIVEVVVEGRRRPGTKDGKNAASVCGAPPIRKMPTRPLPSARPVANTASAGQQGTAVTKEFFSFARQQEPAAQIVE